MLLNTPDSNQWELTVISQIQFLFIRRTEVTSLDTTSTPMYFTNIRKIKVFKSKSEYFVIS